MAKPKTIIDRLRHAWPRVQLDAMVEVALLLEGRVEEEGNCLLWTGAFCTRGPVVTVAQVQYSLRKIVWEQKNGTPFPAEKVATVSCGNPRCLEHVQAKTWSQLNSRPTSISHRMRTALARRKGSKLTDEAVSDIRYGSDKPPEAAARHGCSVAYVYMIRRDHSRKDYSSPFRGLFKEAA